MAASEQRHGLDRRMGGVLPALRRPVANLGPVMNVKAGSRQRELVAERCAGSRGGDRAIHRDEAELHRSFKPVDRSRRLLRRRDPRFRGRLLAGRAEQFAQRRRKRAAERVDARVSDDGGSAHARAELMRPAPHSPRGDSASDRADEDRDARKARDAARKTRHGRTAEFRGAADQEAEAEAGRMERRGREHEARRI